MAVPRSQRQKILAHTIAAYFITYTGDIVKSDFNSRIILEEIFGR